MTLLQEWLISALFALGALIVLLGIAMMLMPGHIVRAGASLNRWISTDRFFHNLDRPRHTERALYRHHRILGACIIAGSLFILYVFLFQLRLQLLIENLPTLGNPAVSDWVYSSAIYLLEAGAVVTLLIGAVVVMRPSLLKKLEEWSNHWVETGTRLRGLDRRHDIPESIFPGNLRLFGLAVLLGGIYIMLSTGAALLG